MLQIVYMWIDELYTFNMKNLEKFLDNSKNHIGYLETALII